MRAADPEGERLRREVKLGAMKRAAQVFYGAAVKAHCHALIEFTGLMNKFIEACARAEVMEQEWEHANVHGSERLPLDDGDIAYLIEKLDCIYGDALWSAPLLLKKISQQPATGAPTQPSSRV